MKDLFVGAFPYTSGVPRSAEVRADPGSMHSSNPLQVVLVSIVPTARNASYALVTQQNRNTLDWNSSEKQFDCERVHGIDAHVRLECLLI
jgi:hypothetical protein